MVKNAFDFAEFVFQELNAINDEELELYVGRDDDDSGFHSRHHHIFKDQFSDSLKQIARVFSHIKSREFVTRISGRDCLSDGVNTLIIFQVNQESTHDVVPVTASAQPELEDCITVTLDQGKINPWRGNDDRGDLKAIL